MQLLILHEIAYKASLVTNKAKYRQFERWLGKILSTYKDAAVERYARIYLFQLKEQYA
jgi:hypothetical protein